MHKIGFNPIKFTIDGRPDCISVISVTRQTIKKEKKRHYVPLTILINHFDSATNLYLAYGPKG